MQVWIWLSIDFTEIKEWERLSPILGIFGCVAQKYPRCSRCTGAKRYQGNMAPLNGRDPASTREMEKWHADIQFLDDWSYFDSEEKKLGVLKLFRNIEVNNVVDKK